ncbi:MAG: 2,3,4,5-tetrahydropyridine-2,6-dicarboxylate N-succinyltransferase [bacterium]
MDSSDLQWMRTALERAFDRGLEDEELDPGEVREACVSLLEALERGDVRAAEPQGHRWVTHAWVKKGILMAFRLGEVADLGPSGKPGEDPVRFTDKDTLPLQDAAGFSARNVRLVPGGSSVRAGAYLGPDVILMPPCYVNVGAWVGEGSLVDSHALVGSCAQVGKRVHLSAAAQLGGVLEPAGARPVIVEDDVVVGGGCGVYEGTVVRRRAVLAAGVVLTASTPVFDTVKGDVFRPTRDQPLEIPEGAVVVPGTRKMEGEWAAVHGLGLQTPIIVKYRDADTDAATSLEEALR